MARRYRVGELARLTKVSVRTLHHYDRIGILRPAELSEGGHRLYSENEMLRLQQILTLRYLGFPLAQIGELLDRPDFDLLASMQIQRTVVRERISQLQKVESALAAMVEQRRSTGAWDWDLVVEASAAVQGRQKEEGFNVESYYTPEQMQQFKELGDRLGPETIRSIEERWAMLMTEVREKRNLDPASPEARYLADSWNALTAETMAHYEAYPDLKDAIGQNYSQGNFEGQPGAPGSEDFAFIQRVNEARSD
jgi:MerR family transcriptional regulator, thiopeptide resistance regulator